MANNEKSNNCLMGYGYQIHKRDNFICQYCGYDGRSFDNWRQLTIDHILPQSQGGVGNEDNLITSCHNCNSITSRMDINRHTRKDYIIKQKKAKVEEKLKEYSDFWKENVE
ncbi:MAG: HNH endonuclease [Nitrospirae bacterium]|nr:HNH endonuclease [Nitrospirota bacterium]MBF0590751.1 HNH endonuclease [Nitrospirota bacterium]